MTPLVFIISPYRTKPGTNGYDIADTIRYAEEIFHQCVGYKEVPYIGHLYMTRFLDDSRPRQRATGMTMNYAFLQKCSFAAVYTNLGISEGMEVDIRVAHDLGIKLVERSLSKWKTPERSNPSLFPPAVTALLPAV